MNTESLKKLLDTCFVAKRITETLPELPKGMKPRHIHVLDAVSEICTCQGVCRVSDVSTRLNITMPSVTLLIQELEQRDLLQKQADREDKRFTVLQLTDAGRVCVKRHVTDFHQEWAEALSDISDGQAMEAICVIERLQLAMPGRKERKNNYGK